MYANWIRSETERRVLGQGDGGAAPGGVAELRRGRCDPDNDVRELCSRSQQKAVCIHDLNFPQYLAQAFSQDESVIRVGPVPGEQQTGRFDSILDRLAQDIRVIVHDDAGRCIDKPGLVKREVDVIVHEAVHLEPFLGRLPVIRGPVACDGDMVALLPQSGEEGLRISIRHILLAVLA